MIKKNYSLGSLINNSYSDDCWIIVSVFIDLIIQVPSASAVADVIFVVLNMIRLPGTFYN